MLKLGANLLNCTKFIRNNSGGSLSLLNYRYFSSTTTATDTLKNDNKKILITTPIFYVNGPPHIGHLYTGILADAFSRWNKFSGNDTLFMTGTDEHGSKVEEAAKKNGLNTVEYTNQISNRFRELFDFSNIKYDDYIRTTEPRHKVAVEAMWNRLLERGYIYKGKYQGWYCMSDESFLTNSQVTEGMSPVTPTNPVSKKCMVSLESGHVVEWLEEENYMFKLSAFKEDIEKWLDNNKVYPLVYENQIRHLLKDGLKDLSISRPTSRCSWGIPVPNDPSQTIYVWLDALTNYMTVTGYPHTDANDPNSYWSNVCHIIGKDIVKFHIIYWPAFLLAAGYPLPQKIICHAHWTVNREKMSKSRGNVVNPVESIEKYGLEGVRYFLLKGGGLEDDGDWSDNEINIKLTADLASTFGNLVSRSTGKALHPSGQWPSKVVDESLFTESDKEMIKEINKAIEKTSIQFNRGDFKQGIYEILDFLYAVNGYIQSQKPWTLVPKKDKVVGDLTRLNTIMYTALECVRIVSLLLTPVIPQATKSTLDHLSIPDSNRRLKDLKFGFDYINQCTNDQVPSTSIILFKRVDK
ncbi:hypothetical protein CYY_001558 [Polysphondylium violaceum]|uniref:methionine--tRNA ligase n=1 Tax=Polysphondylium violaceum TaxID=133409 RepID=A0A8J4Q955_9MYCE|nr:hypothetical protein CYY_001558 [Polysphondylium violaceum]